MARGKPCRVTPFRMLPCRSHQVSHLFPGLSFLVKISLQKRTFSPSEIFAPGDPPGKIPVKLPTSKFKFQKFFYKLQIFFRKLLLSGFNHGIISALLLLIPILNSAKPVNLVSKFKSSGLISMALSNALKASLYRPKFKRA